MDELRAHGPDHLRHAGHLVEGNAPVDIVRRLQIRERGPDERRHTGESRREVRGALRGVRVLETDVGEQGVAQHFGIQLRLSLERALPLEAEERERRRVRQQVVVRLRLRVELRRVRRLEASLKVGEERARCRSRDAVEKSSSIASRCSVSPEWRSTWLWSPSCVAVPGANDSDVYASSRASSGNGSLRRQLGRIATAQTASTRRSAATGDVTTRRFVMTDPKSRGYTMAPGGRTSSRRQPARAGDARLAHGLRAP